MRENEQTLRHLLDLCRAFEKEHGRRPSNKTRLDESWTYKQAYAWVYNHTFRVTLKTLLDDPSDGQIGDCLYNRKLG